MSASASPPACLGHVVSVTRAHANVRLARSARSEGADGPGTTVGKFLAIDTGVSSVVGVITDVDGRGSAPDGALTARVVLLGEIQRIDAGFTRFQRGITGYPMV